MTPSAPKFLNKGGGDLAKEKKKPPNLAQKTQCSKRKNEETYLAKEKSSIL